MQGQGTGAAAPAPALSAPTMQKLEDTPIDRETVDAEIGKAIRPPSCVRTRLRGS